MPISRTHRAACALVLALATLCAALLPTTADTALAAPEDHPDAALAAAEWIDRELGEDQPDFDAFGMAGARTDVLFALASTGSEPGAARQAYQELQEGADAYASSPGAIAKVILAALSQRESPSDVIPGRDLEAELRSGMDGDGVFAADVFNQSLAVLALAATEGGAPTAAVDHLSSLQCDDGSFAFSGVCEDGPDVDTTALALQALLAGDAAASAAAAADYLVAAQGDDGSFPNPFGEPNANTAGVAGQALRAAGEVEAADAAADFVLSLQVEDGPEAGGIRFTAADEAANGFATLQGILAFGAAPFHALGAEVEPYGDVAFTHVFGAEIDWLGDRGVAKGCDPPDNDHFCPDDSVTRGQMAAFLTRALDLPPGDTGFQDTARSVFADDIAAIAHAGITLGCNPPDNDRYCPDDPVTRGQMAAFLTRALDLPPGDAGFEDTAGSVFADDIAAIAHAGITLGCNPPDNDRYCPDDPVTRGQMAAFLFRASAG